MHRRLLAIVAVVLLAAPARAALTPVLTAGDFILSDRSFAQSLAIIGSLAAGPEDLENRVRTYLERSRRDLLLATAARRRGLHETPAIAQQIDDYARQHLVDLYLLRETSQPARQLARTEAAGNQKEENRVYARESGRLVKETTRAARARAESVIDEAALAQALEKNDFTRVVGRFNKDEIPLERVRQGMQRVDHPVDGLEARVRVARILLEVYLDNLALAAAARAAGMEDETCRDEVQNNTVKVLARWYLQTVVYPPVVVPADEVRRRFEAQRESLRRGPEKKVSEILVADKAAADKVLERLGTGASFEAEVAAHSTGHTRDKQGSLGFIRQGELLEPLDAAIRELQPGQVSKVVATQFGFHILKVIEEADRRLPEFEEVAGEIERKLATAMRAEAEVAAVKELESTIKVTEDRDAMTKIRSNR